MKQTEMEESDTKVIFAPNQFYEACDECDSLPEERWEEYREHILDETKTIVEGRAKVLGFAARSQVFIGSVLLL